MQVVCLDPRLYFLTPQLPLTSLEMKSTYFEFPFLLFFLLFQENLESHGPTLFIKKVYLVSFSGVTFRFIFFGWDCFVELQKVSRRKDTSMRNLGSVCSCTS